MNKGKFLAMTVLTGSMLLASGVSEAAQSPFKEVPQDHWAYDAVAQLAADGVLEGYGDGTFQGDKAITRFEMSKMVARAMAVEQKKGVNAEDKALIEKLSAEFGDELKNLGVREWTCPECGQQNGAEDLFCTNCGTKMDTAARENSRLQYPFYHIF